MVLDEFLVRLGVKDDLSPKLGNVGKIIQGVGAAMGAFAVAAGAAAIKIGTTVVQQFGELEQNLGGSEAVFGEHAANIQRIGEDAYKNLGISQSEYLATANKMGALFQGSGVEQQKSLDLTTKAMQRAADMASVMGIDMSIAMESVAGAAKGNFTMMDNLGVAMNATTIEAYAAAKGLDFVWASASQAEKAEVAMQMFFETTEQYAGNFARESTQTISGSLGLLKAAVKSFTAGLGNANADMTNLTGNLVDAFQAVVQNIVPILGNIVSAIPQASTAILQAIGGLLPSLLSTVTGLFSSVLQTILSLLPQLIPAAVEAIITITGTLADNLPLLVDAAIQFVLSLVDGLGQALPKLVPAALNAIETIVSTLISKLPELVDAGMKLMGGLVDGLMNASPLMKVVATAIGVVTAALVAYKVATIASTVAQEIHNALMIVSTIQTGGLAAAKTALAAAEGSATVATWLLNAAMAANPIGLIVAGVAALTAGIIALVSWLNHQSEEEKRLQEQTEALVEETDRLKESLSDTATAYDEQRNAIEKDAAAADGFADKIAALAAVENKSAEQKAQLAAYVDMLNEAMGESVVQYDAETDSMSRNIDEIYAMVEAHKAEAKAQAARERAVEIAKEQMDVEDQLNKINRQRIELDAALAAGTAKKKFYNDEMQKLADTEAELTARQGDLVISFDSATQAVTEAAAATEAANAVIAANTEEVVDVMAEANAKQEQIANDRIAAEQAVTDAMIKAANEQGLTLEEYQNKLESTQAKIEQYTDAATDAFSRLSEESEQSIGDMTDNVVHNTGVVERLGENLAALGGRLDADFLAKLDAAGPKSAGAIATLAAATDDEINKLNEALANGGEAATKALMDQFGLSEVTNSGSDMVDDIAAGVDKNTSLADSTTKLIQEAKAAADETVASGGFDSVGTAIVDGVYDGIQSRQSWFRSQISSFFKGMVTDVKDELGIQSPSKVFAGIGENMAQGVGVGFEGEMPGTGRKIEKSMGGALDFAPAMAEKVAETLHSALNKLQSFEISAPAVAQGAPPNAFADGLTAMSGKMTAFIENANRMMDQMGMATNASYSTTSNHSVSYDQRAYDQRSFDMRSPITIHDASGDPRTTAQMVDRSQSLRIRNARGIFA